MTPRSTSVARICDAAVLHFAERGYDGASLNEIATMVGIRKASLYSHFVGKDALFIQVLQDAVEHETGFARASFVGPAPAGGAGAAYVAAIADRYETSPHLRFLLRAAYLPPAALRGTIGPAYEGFLETLREGYLQQLPQAGMADADRVRFGHAYLGIVESLFVEINYAGRDQMAVRRDALWQVMTDAIAFRPGPRNIPEPE